MRACAETSERHPLAVEPRYLESLVLLGLGRLRESERAARQALYLEPGLAVAHLMLGHILRRQDDLPGALRAFTTAANLCATLPPEDPVPLGDGERAGRLADWCWFASTLVNLVENSVERSVILDLQHQGASAPSKGGAVVP